MIEATRMKNVLALAALLLMTSPCYTHAAAWTYSGESGPDHWVQLSPEFHACGGMNQSPVNLTGFIEADLQPIEFAYQFWGTEILNNGHTVRVNFGEGNSINVDGIWFDLKQFHFHAPSENQVNGKSYLIKAHLVHADSDGNLAVVAVPFTEGKGNETLAQTWSSMPEHAGDKFMLPSPILASGLLPVDRDYYRFDGSLTTPPCSEGVRWLVMKTPVPVSENQIESLVHVLHHPNNRPIQPINARTVLK